MIKVIAGLILVLFLSACHDEEKARAVDSSRSLFDTGDMAQPAMTKVPENAQLAQTAPLTPVPGPGKSSADICE